MYYVYIYIYTYYIRVVLVVLRFGDIHIVESSRGVVVSAEEEEEEAERKEREAEARSIRGSLRTFLYTQCEYTV